MEIDIRNSTADKVNTIVFADKDCDQGDACLLTLKNSFTKITGYKGEASPYYIYLKSQEDAKNLIKALQKAIELGNWSE